MPPAQPTARSVFDSAAAQYDTARPSYPATLFDELAMRAGPLTGKLVLDWGAGTGIASRQLAERGATVISLDIGEQMLRRALVRSPGSACVLADGNQMPIRSASADVVTFAQSWHWFDHRVAAAEVARVLKPGGLWAAWWNRAKADGERWFEEYQQLVTTSCPGYLWQRMRPGYLGPDWTDELVRAQAVVEPGRLRDRAVDAARVGRGLDHRRQQQVLFHRAGAVGQAIGTRRGCGHHREPVPGRPDDRALHHHPVAGPQGRLALRASLTRIRRVEEAVAKKLAQVPVGRDQIGALRGPEIVQFGEVRAHVREHLVHGREQPPRISDRHQVSVLTDNYLPPDELVCDLLGAADADLEQVTPAAADRPDPGRPAVIDEDRLPGTRDNAVPAEVLNVRGVAVVHTRQLMAAARADPNMRRLQRERRSG